MSRSSDDIVAGGAPSGKGSKSEDKVKEGHPFVTGSLASHLPTPDIGPGSSESIAELDDYDCDPDKQVLPKPYIDKTRLEILSDMNENMQALARLSHSLGDTYKLKQRKTPSVQMETPSLQEKTPSVQMETPSLQRKTPSLQRKTWGRLKDMSRHTIRSFRSRTSWSQKNPERDTEFDRFLSRAEADRNEDVADFADSAEYIDCFLDSSPSGPRHQINTAIKETCKELDTDAGHVMFDTIKDHFASALDQGDKLPQDEFWGYLTFHMNLMQTFGIGNIRAHRTDVQARNTQESRSEPD